MGWWLKTPRDKWRVGVETANSLQGSFAVTKDTGNQVATEGHRVKISAPFFFN